MSRYKKPKRNKMTATAMAIVALLIGMNLGRMGQDTTDQKLPNGITTEVGAEELSDIQDYSGDRYRVLGENVTGVREEDKKRGGEVR